MKKANKEAAREWQQEKAEKGRRSAAQQEQEHLLWYAGCKRKTGFPCPETLRSLGRADVAEKVEQAYRLLASAHELMTSNAI